MCIDTRRGVWLHTVGMGVRAEACGHDDARIQAASGPGQGSRCVTHGVRVSVSPCYLPDQSDPARSRFPSSVTASASPTRPGLTCLLSRHWRIIDADGELKDVRGEGVVGQQPHIPAGKSFGIRRSARSETLQGDGRDVHAGTSDEQLVEVAVRVLPDRAGANQFKGAGRS